MEDKNASERVERFGFLDSDLVLDIPGVSIEPLPALAAKREKLTKGATPVIVIPGGAGAKVDFKDGCLYPTLPPGEQLWRLRPEDGTSHVMRLTGKYVGDVPRTGVDIFLLHLLGFLFGVRLQFEDLWMDGRVAVSREQTGSIRLGSSGQVATDFLARALETWSGWPPDVQTRFTELLFAHTRLPMYHWQFEQFQSEYAVTDGLWKVATLLWTLRANTHPERLEVLRKEFGLYDAPGPPPAGKMLAEFARLRRDLVHEARWDKAMLGTGGATSASELAPGHVRRFNERLVVAMLGYTNKYVLSNWAVFSPTPFEKMT